jgi:hypothetical protein
MRVEKAQVCGIHVLQMRNEWFRMDGPKDCGGGDDRIVYGDNDTVPGAEGGRAGARRDG